MNRNKLFTLCFVVIPMIYGATIISDRYYGLKPECSLLQRNVPTVTLGYVKCEE